MQKHTVEFVFRLPVLTAPGGPKAVQKAAPVHFKERARHKSSAGVP
jgi:hypothetical protein